METERFSEHVQSLFSNLEEFRANGLLCDVVLKVGGHFQMAAHKLVLASFSAYFRAMFTSDFSETQQSCVVLHELEPHALETLVLFAYTGKVCVTTSNVQALLSAATLLQVNRVQKRCCDFLLQHMSVENCIGIWNLADVFSCRDLAGHAVEFVLKHFEQVVDSQEFSSLNAANLITLLQSDDLKVSSERPVLDAVLKWAKFNPSERSHHLIKVLKHVHLAQFTPSFLHELIANEAELFSLNSYFPQVILDAAVRSSRASAVAEFPGQRRDYTYSHRYLLAVGGETSGSTLASSECFNIEDETWRSCLNNQERIASLTESRSGFGSVSVGRHAYVIGGVTSGTILRSVERFEPPVNTWRSVAPLPCPRAGPCASVMGTKLFVTGGFSGGRYLDSVAVYDPYRDSWGTGVPMLERRGNAGSQCLGDVLYVCGGCRVESGRDSFLSSVECFYPQSERWVTGPPLTIRRAYFGLVAARGSLYAVGGFNSQWLKHVERWDPREDRWQAVQPMTSSRSSGGMCVLDDAVYSVGGFDGSDALNSSQCLDLKMNRWRQLPSMTQRRYSMGLLPVTW